MVGVEVNVSANDLILQSGLVSVFTKAKSQQIAILLVGELIDEETRTKSNVHGKGKEKLDPTIIEYV